MTVDPRLAASGGDGDAAIECGPTPAIVPHADGDAPSGGDRIDRH
jgi:hypothetical protein